MQNKSAALSSRRCGGTSCFRLTTLLCWRHKKCVFFEVFPKQLLTNVWLSSVLEVLKIRPWYPHLRRRSGALQAGRHSSIAWVKDRSLWTVAVLRLFCVEHRQERFLYCFFSFIFLPLNAPMFCLSLHPVLWSMQAPLPDLCQEIYVAFQKEKKGVYKRIAKWNVKRGVSNNEVVLCKF